MNKHEVYTFIADNPEWFKGQNQQRFMSCKTIGSRINKALKKDGDSDPPFIKLNGATLTAMVYDGVLERAYSESDHCYWYRPTQPIVEDYKSE